MRLWSVHPSFLDTKGLLALWRESLLAKKVLQGLTRGYTRHPQLDRFRKCSDPVMMIDAYLTVIAEEARQRGFRFDQTKYRERDAKAMIELTKGQLIYETEWLRKKLRDRDPVRLLKNGDGQWYKPHPLFTIVEGDIEPWEKALL